MTLAADTRVLDVARDGERIPARHEPSATSGAARVVLATGGQSLPKSGSDGAGFEIARRLGHTIVPTTPALVPLLLASGDRIDPRHAERRRAAVELTLWIDGTVSTRLTGSLLWTHFGISGPVTLEHVAPLAARAGWKTRPSSLTANFCPGQTFEDVERLVDSAARPSGRTHRC